MAICLTLLRITKRLVILLLLEIVHTLRYMASFFVTKDLILKLSILINGHRRLIFLCLAFIIFCLYSIYMLFPLNYTFQFSKEYVETSSLDVCINDRIARFSVKIGDIDAVKYTDRSENQYYSFIGNGYFGVDKNVGGSILIKNDKVLSLKTVFDNPFLSLSVPDYLHKENSVLDFLSGQLVTFQCYKQSSLCISITSTSYAHRTRPQLFIQEIRVHNPTKSAVQIAVRKNSNKNEMSKLLKTVKINSLDYEIFVQNIVMHESNKHPNQTYIVVYARPVFPKYISIPLTGDNSFAFISGIKYKSFIKVKDNNQEIVDMLFSSLIESLKEAHRIPIKELRFEHETVWKSLWNTGISTDRSLAPGAINGNQINSTIYYLLSNSQAYMNIKGLSQKEKNYRESFMYKASHCFNTHDTLYVKNLWSLIETQSTFINQVKKWMIMLRKYGCGLLIKSGASGLMQAIVYSAGSFNFVGDHISFGMHPNDLQRKLYFRNLLYKTPNFTKFNVLVNLDRDNKPQLWVSVSDTKSPLFACDAGCVDPPVALSTSFIQLPVKLTVPRHPILYISDQLSHIHDLKQVVHFGQIEDAKAHNHQLISLHKHGHSWGGLPPLFWVCIIMLVVFFHMFLCKIIYSEYCHYRNDYDFSISDNCTKSTVISQSLRHQYVPSTRRSQYYQGFH